MHTHACVCKPIHQLLLLPHYKDAFKPSTGCDALCVHVLSHPHVDQVHAAASLCTCDVCALTCRGLGRCCL